MATITTQDVPIGVTTIWEQPSSVGGNQSGIPIAKMVFSNVAFVIPAKVNTDVSQVTIDCVLPVNYAYRLTYTEIAVQAATGAPYFDFQPGMGATLTTGVGDVSRFLFTNHWVQFGGAVSPGNGAAQILIAGGLHRVNFVAPDKSNLLFDNSTAGGGFHVSWIDASSDATIAVTISYRFELMMYTIDALQSWRANIPTLVMGSAGQGV